MLEQGIWDGVSRPAEEVGVGRSGGGRDAG